LIRSQKSNWLPVWRILSKGWAGSPHPSARGSKKLVRW
jgi:hypothetical protein